MNTKKQEFEFLEITDISELGVEDQHLVRKARAAAKKAYAPFSGFKVGAAVMLQNGEIITGSNQENASYPSGLCAERTALFYAGSSFPDVPVKTIALTAYQNGGFLAMPVSPCGACRQVIMEVQERSESPIRIIMYGAILTRIVNDGRDLLPFPFEKPGV